MYILLIILAGGVILGGLLWTVIMLIMRLLVKGIASSKKDLKGKLSPKKAGLRRN